MTQVQMSTLLGISIRTLQTWKHKKNREKLYVLLEQLDYQVAQELLQQKDHKHLITLLENQEHFTSYRDFEAALFNYLTSKASTDVLKKMAKNTNLSKEARARSAYLYSFLTNKPLKLSFTLKQSVGLYHGRNQDTGDGLARYYGLLSGVDMQRFNQYKMTGSN